MRVINIPVSDFCNKSIPIGRRAETKVTQVVFDVSLLEETFGSGTVVFYVKNSPTTDPYPVTVEYADSTVTWTVSNVDTQYVGVGRCELWYYVGDTLAKTLVWKTVTEEDIGAPSATPPDPYETWLDNLSDLASQTQQNAQDAYASAQDAETAQGLAEGARDDAIEAKDDAESARDEAVEAVGEITNLTATATTLAEGSSATANYDSETGVLSLGIPKGDTGEQGIQGETGQTGATPDFSIGTVTTGNAGTSASASITGTAENPVLNLTIPRGDKGNTGETGATGATGATPNITIGTVTTGEAGSSASATMTGTAENPVLNLTIPRGDTGEVSEADFVKAFPHDTATGAIATFSDGADDMPCLDVVCEIEPVQDLNGYDNPWPEGGGKNVLPSPTSIEPSGGTTITNNNGVLTIISTGAGQSTINIPSFTFAASGQKIELLNSFTSGTVRFYNGDTQIDFFSLSTENRVISASSLYLLQGQTIDNYRIQVNGVTSGTLGIMITPDADTALSAFSPYSNICPISGHSGLTLSHSDSDTTNPTTYPISWQSSAGTVYGGTLDVTSGVLTVDRAMVDLGTLSWTARTITNQFFYATISDGAYTNSSSQVSGSICSALTQSSTIYMGGSNAVDLTYAIGAAYIAADVCHVMVKYDACSSTSELVTALDGVQLVYPLATPITYQLTPTEIRTLLGSNNVWHDANGDTTVSYPADPTLYIQKVIADAIASI